MSPSQLQSDFSGFAREELEIRLRQALNDLRLTKDEARENALKYMEMVGELGDRNVELQALKDGLEDMMRGRREEGSPSGAGFSGQPLCGLASLLEFVSSGVKGLADSKGAAIELSAVGDGSTDLRFQADSPLAKLLAFLASGLLQACGSGSVLSLKGKAVKSEGLFIELRASGKGVDASLLEGFVSSVKPPASWESLPGFVKFLTGWSVSPASSGDGFLVASGDAISSAK